MARDVSRDFARDWMWSEACEMLARAERMHRDLFRPAALADAAAGLGASGRHSGD